MPTSRDDPNTVKVSLDKIQRSGVRTEKVEARSLSRTVRGIGTIKHDESLLWIVTVRSDGYIEELFVNKTGQHVRQGEPLFRFYSSQIQLAQADLLVALRAEGTSSKAEASRSLAGAMQKLRNLDVPDSRIDEVRKTLTNPRTIDWAFARDRRRRREEGHPGPAGDGRRRAVSHRQSLQRLGGRRGGRVRYRRD